MFSPNTKKVFERSKADLSLNSMKFRALVILLTPCIYVDQLRDHLQISLLILNELKQNN